MLYHVLRTPTHAVVLPSRVILLTAQQDVAYIESPGFPDALYPKDTQQQFDVKVHLGDRLMEESARIQVTFEVFLMEKSYFCHKDGFDIVDRTGEVRAYCGPQGGRNFLMQDSHIRMRMFTDETVEDRGFRIRVKLFQSPCGGIFQRQGSGIIMSPHHPYAYTADSLCIWRIEAPRNMLIKLEFTSYFDIRSEDDQTCLMDYLAVSRTGNFSTDTKRYCGQTRPRSIISKTNKLELKFVSDCIEDGRGFKVRFDLISAYNVPMAPSTIPYIPQSCSRVDCGKAHDETARIVGGSVFRPHKYPWLVPIFDDFYTYICSGSLISPRFVLTAAHCCEDQKKLYVKLGAHSLREGLYRPVSQCVIHPGYKRRNYVNDIAVIELAQSARLNDFVRRICLPVEEVDTTGKSGVIGGWGRESYGGRDRDTPKDAEVPFVSNAECVSKFGSLILDTNICAGGLKEDTCQGDSGGPLVSQSHVQGKYVQLGLVSTGIGCGREGFPGVYTFVQKYHDFVYNVTKEPWCTIKNR
ncbi:ovochymase-2-like [Ixodes scapularis]